MSALSETITSCLRPPEQFSGLTVGRVEPEDRRWGGDIQVEGRGRGIFSVSVPQSVPVSNLGTGQGGTSKCWKCLPPLKPRPDH